MNSVKKVLLNRIMLWLCGDKLWELARAWVRLYENKEMSGKEKQERVLNMLQIEVQTLGLDIATSLINLAIEAAVQYLRIKSS